MLQKRHPRRAPPWRRPVLSRNVSEDVGAFDDGDGEGWQLMSQFASVARATTAALLSSSVSIAQGFNQHNDEIVPLASSESSMLGTFGQRGRHDTRFIKWVQVDELPTPVAPVALDDVYLIPPRGVIPEPNGIFWATDEGSIPGVVADEEYWWRTAVVPAQIPRDVPRGEDEVVTTASAIVEEDVGILSNAPLPTAKYPSAADDEAPQQQVATVVDDEYWTPIRAKLEPIGVYTIVHQDEVFPSIATEEGGWEPPYRIQPNAQSLSLAGSDLEIVPQPTPLGIDEIYQITFYVSPEVSKVSMPSFVENDVPVLSTPVAASLVEWLVRARRRGVR